MKQSAPYLTAIVISLALASFMGRLDTNIVNIALPSIAHHFSAGIESISYVMLGFALSVAGTVFFAGGMVDYLGGKKTLLAGYSIFSLASFGCGIAPSPLWLIVGRCLQGIGSALLVTSAYAVIPDLIPAKKVGKTMGIMTASGSIGLLAGAPLGGILTGVLSWRSIFFINIPFGICAVAMILRYFPRFETSDNPKFDWLGCLLSGAGLCLTVLGLNMLQHDTVAVPGITISASGIAAFIAYYFWQKRHPDPVFDLSLLSRKRILLGLVSKMLVFMTISAQALMMPFYLERICGLGPEKTGAVFAVFGIAVFLVSPLAGRLADCYPAGYIMMVAMTGGVLACLFFAVTMGGSTAVWSPLIYLAMMGGSFGMFLSPSAKMILSLSPPGKRGSTTSMMLSLVNLGIALGITIAVFLYTAFSGVNLTTGGDVAAHDTAAIVDGFRAVYLFCCTCCLGAALLSSRLIMKVSR